MLTNCSNQSNNMNPTRLYFFEAFFDRLGNLSEHLDTEPALDEYSIETKMLELAATNRSTAEAMIKAKYPSARYLLLHEIRELEL